MRRALPDLFLTTVLCLLLNGCIEGPAPPQSIAWEAEPTVTRFFGPDSTPHDSATLTVHVEDTLSGRFYVVGVGVEGSEWIHNGPVDGSRLTVHVPPPPIGGETTYVSCAKAVVVVDTVSPPDSTASDQICSALLGRRNDLALEVQPSDTTVAVGDSFQMRYTLLEVPPSDTAPPDTTTPPDSADEPTEIPELPGRPITFTATGDGAEVSWGEAARAAFYEYTSAAGGGTVTSPPVRLDGFAPGDWFCVHAVNQAGRAPADDDAGVCDSW